MPSYLRLVVPYRRGRSRGSRSSTMNPIQSFKQISVDGPASRAAGTDIVHSYAFGVDNYTGPGANNNEIPTGAKVSSVTIMAAFTNLVSVSALVHFQLECLRSGQSGPTPGAVGGNPERNNVIHTRMFFIGQNQNTNLMFRVKIPRIFQRVREGDIWTITYRCDAVFASATQAIYKFFR